jgi:hypothetical protein
MKVGRDGEVVNLEKREKHKKKDPEGKRLGSGNLSTGGAAFRVLARDFSLLY